MNGALSMSLSGRQQTLGDSNETESRFVRYCRKETTTMIILMLAAAMMIAMLIATAFGLHEESNRLRGEAKIRKTMPFGRRS